MGARLFSADQSGRDGGSSPPAAVRGWTATLARRSSIALIAYIAVIAFPGSFAFAPEATGLGPSWVYALNFLPVSASAFGRDVAFNYGPLGYLLYPLDVGNNLVASVVFRVIVHTLFVLCVLHYVLKSRNPGLAPVAVAGIGAAFSLGLGPGPNSVPIFSLGLGVGPYCLLTQALLAVVSRERARWWSIASVLSGVLGAVLLFAKLSFGLGALTVIIVAAGVQVSIRRPPFTLRVALPAVSFLLTFATLSGLYLGPVDNLVDNLVRWIRASIEIVQGYNVAMSLVGPGDFLASAFAGLVAVCVPLAVFALRKNAHLADLLILSSLIPLAFKQGFVRQDGHVMYLFPVLVAILAITCTWAGDRMSAAATTTALVAAVAVAIPVATAVGGVSEASLANLLSGQRSGAALASIVNLPATRVSLRSQGAEELATDRLPDNVRRLIRAGGSGVDVVPWEVSAIPANDLTWDPSPVLQTYVAYTEDLDRWEAAHYSSGTAPAFVLAQFLDIDGRNPVLAEPATWRAIMEHYRVVATTGSPTWVVLEKDPSAPPSSLPLGQVAPATARIGDVVPVPPAADLEYAHFRLVPTPVARIAAALYQIPPVFITLTYESGDVEVSRLLPDTTSNGIPLNIVPVDTADFLHLLQGRASDRVTAFRIAGPGAAFYLPNLSIRWEDSGHAVAYQPSRRVPIANLPSSRSNIAFAVDAVGDRTAPKSGSLIELSDDGTETVGISGWAVDPVAHRAAKAVYIDIDGTLDVPAHYGLERHDVAEYLGDPGDELSGFSAHLEDRLLVNGPHSITFKVLSDDGSHIYVPNYALRIDVR